MKIVLKGVTKSFGTQIVLHPIEELTIQSGELTTFLGPSGCGKTTLLRMISGLETPDEGEIWFDDICVFSSKADINLPPEKRNLGFVFQDFALWPHLTVFENVAFGLRARKQTKSLEADVNKALKMVRLEDFGERYPHQLSGGQQQRVAFARALAAKPKCILFDEPLSALDAILRDEMRLELTNLVQELGLTALFVTHDQIEAMSMSDSVVVMNKGNIDQVAPPETIYQKPATGFVAKFVGRSNWLNEKQMFRPEALSLKHIENSLAFEMEVASTQFIGNAFELTLKKDSREWYIISNKRPKTNAVTVYLKDEDILDIQMSG